MTMDADAAHIRLSPLTLDPASGLSRLPPSHLSLDGPADFDASTVFYDAFRARRGGQAVLLGPPLFNLEEVCVPAVRSAFGLEPQEGPPPQQTDFRTTFRLPTTRASGELPSGLFVESEVVLQPNACDLFAGRCVLTTMSKDNDLAWIRDWAYFFARTHGCDAVLLYDNNSSAYASCEVQAALASVPGVDVAVVVSWPYLYGTRGTNYCQFAMLDHARRRFLESAAVVINGDIDELVLTDGAPLCELVKASRGGYLRYNGPWIGWDVDGEQPARPRHRDYVYRLPFAEPSLPKWAAVPALCPDQADWRVHRIEGHEPDEVLSARVSFRHFQAINTQVFSARWRPTGAATEHAVVDEDLRRAMRVFDDGT